jgi:hypothetical protein
MHPHAGHGPRLTQTPAQCGGAERRAALRGMAVHCLATVRLQQLRPLQRLAAVCHGAMGERCECALALADTMRG